MGFFGLGVDSGRGRVVGGVTVFCTSAFGGGAGWATRPASWLLTGSGRAMSVAFLGIYHPPTLTLTAVRGFCGLHLGEGFKPA